MDQQKKPYDQDDNFDRVFIGKPGCMLPLIGLVILIIVIGTLIVKQNTILDDLITNNPPGFTSYSCSDP